jgi:uncharacterized protein YfiM (DUF2279 family)
MDGVLQLTALLVGLAGTPPPALHAPADTGPRAVAHTSVQVVPGTEPHPIAMPLFGQRPADPWLSEDKFRHAAASWAAMVFSYAAARAVHDDSDTAFAVALPVTAGLGIAKEVADRRRGGPFSFRDLAADALGAGAAWFFLREMR